LATAIAVIVISAVNGIAEVYAVDEVVGVVPSVV
jgi:hypothetical protein